MSRIGIVGANGQVAAEVALILHQAGYDVVPICRGPRGSAFLRYMGLAVRHGSASDLEDAKRLYADCDVIANFALASGTAAEIREAHDRLIDNSFRASPEGASVIFFSTLAANANFVAEGSKVQRSAYGREKLRNEAQVAKLARATARRAITLRLGHVCGEYQGITHAVRQAITAGPVMVPDSARHANAVATVTIADVIAGVAEGRIAAEGRYDLVNTPRWDWRTLLDYEAAQAQATLVIVETRAAVARSGNPIKVAMRGIARAAFGSAMLKNQSARLLALLPGRMNDQVKSRYFAQRARNEIAALSTMVAPVQVDAALVPGMDTTLPRGLRDTGALLADAAWRAPVSPVGPSWPADR
ncbi:MAG: NAD-dependent epimerase/dehydratase family protein [Sphingomonas sp.]